jgi:threonine/homoserine/homoserine lactone efflux protein
MVVLAAVPSVSVLAVSARSASFGFVHGAFTALGIVVGDLMFIMLAIFGLALLVEAMGNFFFLVKYLGGTYLIWMGIAMWQARPTETGHIQASSIQSSFMSGLLITLGDQKAVLFYLGFLPAFLDLHAMAYHDIGIVSVVTILAVGGVKLTIAYAADRAGTFFGAKAGQKMTIAAAFIMIAAGGFVIIRA